MFKLDLEFTVNFVTKLLHNDYLREKVNEEIHRVKDDNISITPLKIEQDGESEVSFIFEGCDTLTQLVTQYTDFFERMTDNPKNNILGKVILRDADGKEMTLYSSAYFMIDPTQFRMNLGEYTGKPAEDRDHLREL